MDYFTELHKYELPFDLETDEYEDILTELIGSIIEYVPTAAGETLYTHVSNFDYIIDAVWVYGSESDRKVMYVDSHPVFAWAHGDGNTIKFDPENMVIPKGSRVEIVMLSASSGYHGVFIFGKKIYLKDLEKYRK